MEAMDVKLTQMQLILIAVLLRTMKVLVYFVMLQQDFYLQVLADIYKH